MLEKTDDQFFEWVEKFANEDPHELALKSKKYPDLPIKEIVSQILLRKKAKTKLPEWFSNKRVLFPSSLSMEQCSSEITAKYKASIFQGESLIDMTGGAGVDTYYLSINFKDVTYCERNTELVSISKYNFHLLGITHIKFETTNSVEYLQNVTKLPTHVFVDPARRDSSNQKMHAFENCEPNITELVPELILKGTNVLVKASPMLDIKQGLLQIPQVSEVHVVSVNNECKEVLFLIDPDKKERDVRIITNNISGNRYDYYEFTYQQEEADEANLSEPKNFLYQPNNAILKAGAFKSVASAYGVEKLHQNTHLYTSNELVANFPGRIFKIRSIATANKKELKKVLLNNRVSITTKNYPLSVDQVKKKYDLVDGDSHYLFFTKSISGKLMVIICEKP